MFCCHIGHDITVQIRKNHYFHPTVEVRIQHLRTHGIHQTFLNLDLRIFFSYFADGFDKVSVYQFYDIGFCDDRNIFLAVLSCVLKSGSRDAFASLLGLHFKVDRQIFIHLDAFIAPDVFTLDILAEECPVDIFFFDLDRTNCRKQFQFPAKQAVGTHQVRKTVSRSRCYHRSFQQNIAFFHFFEYLCRKTL